LEDIKIEQIYLNSYMINHMANHVLPLKYGRNAMKLNDGKTRRVAMGFLTPEKTKCDVL